MTGSPCCVPAAGAGGPRQRPVPAREPEARTTSRRKPRSRLDLASVPAGRYRLGGAFGEGYAADGEQPVHDVQLSRFRIAEVTVTNAAFAAFVKDTGHLTTAELLGGSAVFHLDHHGARSQVRGAAQGAPWWLDVRGACWRHPEGPGTGVERRRDHPVVHVSHDDAVAFCGWAGLRLPTEAEWEAAARGGLKGARYPWGDEPPAEHRRWPCNIFQGRFPAENTVEDGWASTAPARSFPPNGYGLHQVAGNVWEWCSDWFASDAYRHRLDALAGEVPPSDPTGPPTGTARVMRGGSFLCHDSYCNRYRVAARSCAPPDSTAANLGFRCAADATG